MLPLSPYQCTDVIIDHSDRPIVNARDIRITEIDGSRSPPGYISYIPRPRFLVRASCFVVRSDCVVFFVVNICFWRILFISDWPKSKRPRFRYYDSFWFPESTELCLLSTELSRACFAIRSDRVVPFEYVGSIPRASVIYLSFFGHNSVYICTAVCIVHVIAGRHLVKIDLVGIQTFI